MEYGIKETGSRIVRWEVLERERPGDFWDHVTEAFTKAGAEKIARKLLLEDKQKDIFDVKLITERGWFPDRKAG